MPIQNLTIAKFDCSKFINSIIILIISVAVLVEFNARGRKILASHNYNRALGQSQRRRKKHRETRPGALNIQPHAGNL